MKRFYSKGLLFAVGAAVLVLAGTSWAATLVVGPGETYTTIQSAVNVAAAGDIIQVQEGTYDEDVVISTNNLTLTSVDGAGLAVVRGMDVESGVFTIDDAYGVTIDGFTILPGVGNDYGIYFSSGTGPTDPVAITNNTMEDFSDYGFYASWSYMTGTSFTFTNNTMQDCGTGIYVYGFDGCTIRINDNTAIDCTAGMDLEEFDEGMGTDAQVMGNTVTLDNSTPSSSTGLYVCCPENTTYVSNNRVEGPYSTGLYITDAGCCGLEPTLVYAEGNTIILDSSLSGGTGFDFCCPENTTHIAGNTVEGPFEYGLYLQDVGCCGASPSIVFVERNSVSGSNYGLYFDELTCCVPGEITVRYNVLEGGAYGINVNSHAYAADPLTVVQFTTNSIQDNSDYGFINGSGELVDAKENWWGDASGPFDDKTLPGTPDYNNLAGTGNRVSDYVDYDPWLTEAPKAAAPVLLSPANGAADVSVTVTLETEPFDAELAVTLKSTIWQVSTASDFSSGLVIDEESTSNLTSYAVPDGTLENGTTYYWRARFRDSDDTLTDWSDTWSFTTETEPAPTPSGGGGGCSAAGLAPSLLLLALPLALLLRKK